MNRPFTLHHGDCLNILRAMSDASVDAVVTDPPYGLAFMGKRWDYDVPSAEIWAECLRVLKPGGHLLAFAGTRTQHRMAVRIEDAGFEIRDLIAWVYGSGFPKSHDVSKAIDRAAGVERRVTGERMADVGIQGGNFAASSARGMIQLRDEPATDAAREWSGWGTALKPSLEPITVARKPLIGTVAENVQAHGTGALNIDACRVPSSTAQRLEDGDGWEDDQCLCASCAATAVLNAKPSTQGIKASTATRLAVPLSSGKAETSRHDIGRPDTGCFDGTTAADTAINSSTVEFGKTQTALFPPDMTSTTSTATRATTGSKTCSACGASIMPNGTGSIIAGTRNLPRDANRPEHPASAARWPANLIHDGSDEVTGLFPVTTSGARNGKRSGNAGGIGTFHERERDTGRDFPADTGSAARFFYCTKASKRDRGEDNRHPTVKPTDLMRYLCRLVTPPGGLVLDPFAGSGSTGKAAVMEGFRFVGIEREAEYVEIARARIAAAAETHMPLFAAI